MSSDRPVAAHAPWAEGEGWAPPVRAKTLRVPAWITMVLLGACALGSVWSAYVGVLLYDFAQDMSVGGWRPASERRAASIDAMAIPTAVLLIALLLAAAAAFIVWFYRCRYNAGLFAPDANRMGQGWSIGAWFVPVGNLWLPKRIANDMWGAAPPFEDGAEAYPPSKAVLNLWWGLWLAAIILERVASEMMESAVEIEQISSAAAFSIAVDGVFVLAAGAAVAFVWRLTGMQEARAARMHGMYPAMPSAAPVHGAPAAASAPYPAGPHEQPPAPR